MQVINYLYNSISPSGHAEPQRPTLRFGATLKKVGAVALSILFFGAPASATLPARNATGVCMPNALPAPVEPYARALTGRVKPKSDGVIERFPSWLAHGADNGYVMTKDGSGSCTAGYLFPSFWVCEDDIAEVEKVVKRNHPEEYHFFKRQPPQERRGGAPISLQEESPVFSPEREYLFPMIQFGSNPQFLQNARATLRFLEQKILQNPQEFFALPEGKILAIIKIAHKLILKNLPLDEGGQKGRFRDQMSMVTEAREGTLAEQHNPKTFEKILIQKGGTKADVRCFRRILDKARAAGSFENAQKSFTRYEWRVFRKVAFIPPMPDQIDARMHEFVRILKTIGPLVVSGDLDGVAAAAWTHHAFAVIHPFGDKNGHLARAFANTMLQLGGHDPFVIPDDQAYTKAIQANHENPGGLTRYFEGLIQWLRLRPKI